MKTGTRRWAAGLLALGLGLIGRTAWASASTTTALLSIDVTVNASVGVQINGVTSSTDTVASVTPGGSPVVSAGSMTVTSNAGGGILEFWKLNSTNTADSSGGASPWTLATSTFGASAPGTNQFAIQALFVSSNAAAGSCSGVITTNGDWNAAYAPALTYNPVYYTVNGGFGSFADQTTITNVNGNPDFTSGPNINRMQPSGTGGVGQRGMCYRIIPPTSVTNTDNQIIYLTVTASSS